MKCIFEVLSLIVCMLTIACVNSETFNRVAYQRHGACRNHRPADDEIVRSYSKMVIPEFHVDKLKGFMGTVGIVGGSVDDTGSAYFAAMAAYKVGADSVHIFCTKLAGPALQSLIPEVVVHPIHDVNVEIFISKLNNMDVIVMGPGLDREPHSANVIIPRVVLACKTLKKPLIIDLDPYFLTQAVVNLFLKYPEPGVIWITNGAEFEMLYPMIKNSGDFSNAQTSIDFEKMGESILFFRKGCTDMAISSNPIASWSLSKGGSFRRSAGQGDMIAGATGIYYYWTVNSIAANVTATQGRMLPAAVASYYAAKMMRAANYKGVRERGRSTITSDMLTYVQEVLYGSDSIMDETEDNEIHTID